MAVLGGCHEGKATPVLTEVLCPECGEEMEVFINQGISADQAGRTVGNEKCPKCGHVISEGTPKDTLKLA